jgi:predicted nuclease of predicted toxin-antitoxin system
LKLLIDENLPPVMARSLQALFADEHEIVALRDKFNASGVTDLEWIKTLGNEGNWSVLTADVRIAKNRVERDAFLSNNIVGFVMAPDVRKRALTLQMARLLTIWLDLEKQSQMVSNGLFRFGIKGSKFKSL